MKKLFAILFSICFLCSISKGVAQEIHGNPNIWSLILTNFDISEKWSFGNEIHFRYDNYLDDQQQFLLRPFLNYKLSDGVVLSGGYSFIRTFPYGDFPLQANLDEHNVWEQLTFNHSYGELKVSHRYRLEHRFISTFNGEEFTFEEVNQNTRFRYRLTLTQPISNKLFINVFDELWVKSGSEGFSEVVYDRNWFYAGLGYHLGNSSNIQFAYLYQYTRNNSERYQKNHGAQITLITDF